MEDTRLCCFCNNLSYFSKMNHVFHYTKPNSICLSSETVFYTPSILLSSIISITHIFLEITKIRHSIPAEDLTVLSRENTTPCVLHMTLCAFCFSQQFDVVGFCSVFHLVYLLDAILQKSCLRSHSQPLLIDRLFLHKDLVLLHEIMSSYLCLKSITSLY